MARDATSRPGLTGLVTLAAALDRDAQLPATEQAARDRRIADALGTSGGGSLGETLFWLDAVCADDAPLRDLRQNVQGAVALASAVAVGIGLLFGLSAALGAFYYDGASRVNVVGIVAIFALCPALLLLPFVLSALPGRWLQWLPGVGALGPVLRGLSPGRLARLALRASPDPVRQAMARVLGRTGAHQRQYAQVQKWAVLRWSQLVALGLQAAALLAALWLVVFTDLAFGWSTTLTSDDPAVDAGTVHAITAWIAFPWSWAWPEAAPSLDLVAASRYYRLTDGPVSAAEAARLGGWWRFVVMTMLVYGLGPRLVTFTVAHLRLGRAVRRALVSTPGVDAVRRRLHLARVRTRATDTEEAGEAAPGEGAAATVDRLPVCRLVLNWSDVPVSASHAAALAGTDPSQVWPAGGRRTLDEDRNMLAGVGPSDDDTAVAVLVKAWEPPVEELFDFLALLRDRIGDGASILLLPVGMNETGAVTEPSASELAVWRRAVASHTDPWLRVATAPAPGWR